MSGELQIQTASAMQMAQAMFGSGVVVVSATYLGHSGQAGIYSGADVTMPGVAPSDSGVILSTGKVADFTQSSGDPNLREDTTTAFGTMGDAMLSLVSGQTTFDAAILSASFVPTGNMLTMQIVFASEEYLEYVNQGFNDAVAIWVNGVPAMLTVGSGDITIDNINNRSNQNLYVDNPSASNTYNTEMDGFTVTLTLKVPVLTNQLNTFRLAIADAGDRLFDSAVLIAAHSVQVALVARDDSLTARKGGQASINVLQNDVSNVHGVLTITKVNGVDVTVGSKVTLPSGDVITVGANGLLLVDAADHKDQHTLTYEVTDSAGITDVAFLSVTIVACFAAGTRIAVPDGRVAVEALEVGDPVLTRDHGAQPVRWIGRSVRAAAGDDAPVEIRAGTFGNHGTLRLSQCHRVLIEGPLAELLFGEAEVLVKAKHLVDGRAVRVVEGGEVAYYHLLFDRHEVVSAEGLPCESYHPGPETLAGFGRDALERLFGLFPGLRRDPSAYGGLARPELKARETAVLLAQDGPEGGARPA